MTPVAQRGFTSATPTVIRPQFDVIVPPKWALAMPADINAKFGMKVSTTRPELFLQAFMHSSFVRGGGSVSMSDLSPLGKAVLRLTAVEAVAAAKKEGAKVTTAALWKIITDPALHNALLCNVWKLQGHILAEADVQRLRTVSAGRLLQSERPVVTNEMAHDCVLAILAATYLNIGFPETERFVMLHVITPLVTLASAQ